MESFLKGESGAVFLILYLLPGFLAILSYDLLVERDKPTLFDRIIFALVLTVISSMFLHSWFDTPLCPIVNLSNTTSITDIFNSFSVKYIFPNGLFCTVIGIVCAVLNNYGILYKIANTLKLTYKNSVTDVWADVFLKNKGYWVCLRYQDGRRLIGWVEFYSSYGKPKELFVADAIWCFVDENDAVIREENVNGPGVYINDFSQIIAIELLN